MSIATSKTQSRILLVIGYATLTLSLWRLLNHFFNFSYNFGVIDTSFDACIFLLTSVGIIFLINQKRKLLTLIGIVLLLTAVSKFFFIFGNFDQLQIFFLLNSEGGLFMSISAILIGFTFITFVLDGNNKTHMPEVTSLSLVFFSFFGLVTDTVQGNSLSLFSATSSKLFIFWIIVSLSLFIFLYTKSIGLLKRSSQFFLMVVLVMMTSLMLSVTFLSERFINNSLKASFITHTDQATSSILDRMNLYISALEGGKGFINASNTITRTQWKEYVDTLSIGVNYPGIQGFGYAQIIQPEDKNKHIQKIRSEGFNNYTIKPAGERDVYTSIIYLEPFDERNQQAFGYDMFSNEIRRLAMEKARDTGSPQMTDGVLLVQEIDDDIQVGFLIYVPVYTDKVDLTSLRSKRENIVGYVYSPFRSDDLIGGIFNNEELKNITFSINTDDSFQEESRLYGELPSDTFLDRVNFVRTTNIFVAGKKLSLHFESQQKYVKDFTFSAFPFFILMTGLGISILATMVFYTLLSSRQRAEVYANQLNKDLKKQVVTLEQAINEKHRLNNMFEKAFDDSPIGISIISIDNMWLRVNKRITQLLDYDLSSLLGTSINEITHPQDWKKEQVENKKLIDGTSHTYQMKKRFIHNKGYEIWVEISVGLVRNSDNNPQFFIAHIKDITAQEMIDQTKTDFVSLASHQLRTPLSSINWFVEMLLDEKDDLTESQQKYLSQINASGERMVKLIDDLLNISRAELGTLVLNIEEVNILDLLDETVSDHSLSIKSHNNKLITEIHGEVRSMETDKNNMSIILNNVISNAIKYSYPDTEISLSVKFYEAHIVVSVINKGYGIPASEQPKIFSKMYRATNIISNVSEGFGLGLYLIKKLIIQLGGTIDFISTEKEETTFNMVFPYDQKKSL